MQNLNYYDLKTYEPLYKGSLGESLGIRFTHAEPGYFVATMPVDHRTIQYSGVLHGGASVALAETVASIGGLALVAGQGKVAVGQEINANHLRSVKSGEVRAEAKIIYQGKASQVWEVKIFDSENRMVCISRCTLAVVDMKK